MIAVAEPATESLMSPLFLGEESKKSAARTSPSARKYAGCWEIVEVSTKNIGHAANWLKGISTERNCSVSLNDRSLSGAYR